MGFVNPCQSWLGSWVGVFGHGLWCCLSFASCLWCSWLGLGFGLLMGRVWFRARFACLPPFLVPMCGVGVRAGPGSRLGPAILGWVVGVCFLRLFFFWLCGVGCWVSLSWALWSVPLSPFSRAGLLPFFSSWCVSACFGAPFPGEPLFLAWCCQFWLGGPPVPLWGSCLRCLLGGGLLAGGLVAVGCFHAPPPLFLVFLGGGACLFLPLPSLGWRTHCGRCVVRLVPRHSWRRFLCATPRHSWLGFAASGGGRSSPLLAEGPGCGSPPLMAGVRWRRWCVVCGGGVLVGLWLVCGVVGPSPLLAEVPVCYSPPLLAGFRCRWWCAVLATPG